MKGDGRLEQRNVIEKDKKKTIGSKRKETQRMVYQVRKRPKYNIK